MGDLHDQEKELRVLVDAVENTNEAFVTIDETHRVLFFNRAAEKIFGYSREEVLGRDLSVMMTPDCSRNHRKAVERYIRTRIPTPIGHGAELKATRKDGVIFPARISFSVAEVQGTLYFTGIVTDMTETKALQEAMARSERLAVLGRVVAEIAHEIRNPLLLIGGFAHQLRREAKGDKAQKKLDIISSEVHRLEGLLEELGDLYRPKPLALKAVDIGAMLRHIHLLLKEDSRKRGMHLDVNHPSTPLVVLGDEAKLEQVVLNLAKNSMESMEEGGRLRIQSHRVGDRVEITVGDNGCGIPPGDLEKVFSPFFTTKTEGSGLGLSVSKRIVEDHEGSTFSLSSEPGKGTVFTITFPSLGSVIPLNNAPAEDLKDPP